MGGRLGGIARRHRPRGLMETLSHVKVSRAEGVQGDFRGALAGLKGKTKRQVSLMEAECWAAAMADLDSHKPWWMRRANLLVEGIRLPRSVGTRIRIGSSCLLEVTVECDPCHRMDEIEPGLFAALMPDWRGGFLARVLEDGDVAIGDQVRIEE
jgi:MOSC domain-containing protein YiiM